MLQKHDETNRDCPHYGYSAAMVTAHNLTCECGAHIGDKAREHAAGYWQQRFEEKVTELRRTLDELETAHVMLEAETARADRNARERDACAEQLADALKALRDVTKAREIFAASVLDFARDVGPDRALAVGEHVFDKATQLRLIDNR